MRSGECGFPERSLIRILPAREVLCGIRDLPGTISRVSISSPIVVRGGPAANWLVSNLTTVGCLNWVVPYFVPRSWKSSAMSPHHSCVNSPSFIRFCENLSMQRCTVMEIVPITSVSNGSNTLEGFLVRVGTGTEPLQLVLHHKNPNRCNWARFTTKNPEFQPRNCASY